MGVVYKAEDTGLHRFVALKFQPQEYTRTPQAMARFQREAQAASALNHPNICTIYDIGGHEGHAFIVMEYLDGVTLRCKIAGRPLDLEETLCYAVEIVDALDVAYAAGIIHRDIKTANVLITKRGQAKVLDFGLAKLMANTQSGGPDDPTMVADELTTAGDTLGTVAYMSPEQIEGKPPRFEPQLNSAAVSRRRRSKPSVLLSYTNCRRPRRFCRHTCAHRHILRQKNRSWQRANSRR